MDLYSIFVYSIIYILPAYVANGSPVVFGGGKPLDFGKSIKGKRIFGNNKTIKGTIAALSSGIIIGIVEYHFIKYLLVISILLSIGAVVGDLFGSFVKRQLNLKPGAPFPIMDQFGFFIFAFIFAFPFDHLPNIYGIIFLVVLTGTLHILTNRAAHQLKLKNVPW